MYSPQQLKCDTRSAWQLALFAPPSSTGGPNAVTMRHNCFHFHCIQRMSSMSPVATSSIKDAALRVPFFYCWALYLQKPLSTETFPALWTPSLMERLLQPITNKRVLLINERRPHAPSILQSLKWKTGSDNISCYWEVCCAHLTAYFAIKCRFIWKNMQTWCMWFA